MAEEKKSFLRVEDVAEILECSESHSYTIMRQLNEELAAKGYIVIKGRISAKYFYERIYGGAPS